MTSASSWRASLAAFIVPAALAIAGCATDGSNGPSAGGGPTLAGTEWRLLYFESSDDSIGTIQPGPDEVYTLLLQPDGNAAFGLFCNRGTGRWASGDAHLDRGSLRLEPLTQTMAACPPSRLERVPADLARVASFVIEGGRLHLNLAMDGGNYVWAPSQ